MRSRTQLEQREPPYARWTVLTRFETCAYSRGRRVGTWVAQSWSIPHVLRVMRFFERRLTPGRAMWQSPHLGAAAAFLTGR